MPMMKFVKGDRMVKWMKKPAFELSEDDKNKLYSLCSAYEKAKLEKKSLMANTGAGVLARFGGAFYLVQREVGKPWNDAGGKREGGERFIDTMWREANQEIGITTANVTKVHGVFTSAYYTLLIVDVDKEPVAMEDGSAVKRVEVFSTVAGDKSRLNIWKNRGLPGTLEEIEGGEADDQEAPNHHGFIFD
jgi:hypothetical protein